jgi:indole-3-glycerol phosphate synthase
VSILAEIIENKKAEVASAKSKISKRQLSETENFWRTPFSLVKNLAELSRVQIIAEFKRKSPSKGYINATAEANIVPKAYGAYGAAAISVLTDQNYFGGSAADLVQARKTVGSTPLLRKDFIVDSYQLHEAKAWGADVVLLIAANLEPQQIHDLSASAHQLQLEVLLEVHNEEEIENSPFDHIDIVGVNNRNLKNFAENNVNASLELFKLLPAHLPKISESCIHEPETVKLLRDSGYNGFLIGENFMKTTDPGAAFKLFSEQCNALL